MPTPVTPAPATPPVTEPPFPHEHDVTSVRAALRSPRRLRTEVLGGLVVALALIPEAISFSIIAGVDPRVGLFASFTMAVTIAFVGGRPAMISAATGAVALVIAPLVREHGIDYLVAAVILVGVFQVAARRCSGVAKLMRFIPRSVMVGFVNALAILIFLAQLPAPDRRPVAGLPAGRRRARRHGLPAHGSPPPCRRRWSRSSSLTVITVARRPSPSRPSATRARCPTACRRSFLPHVPFTLDTLPIIAPFALAMALRRAAGVADDGQARRRHHRHPLRTRPARRGARASPTSSPASSAAWAAAR